LIDFSSLVFGFVNDTRQPLQQVEFLANQITV